MMPTGFKTQGNRRSHEFFGNININDELEILIVLAEFDSLGREKPLRAFEP